jgi:Putative lumazine-binding
MKSFALSLTLCLSLLLSISAKAQNSTNDPAAVRATVTNYIEAYYTGDAPRMEASLHPHYLKHMIHGDREIREKTGAQMVEEVRSHGPADIPAAEKTEQVSVMDVAGDIATAKLVTPHWVDYLTLAKSNGAWRILSVVQRIDN